MRRQKGLTLVELAIVLVVLGILVGLGVSIIGVLIKRVKYNESKEIVNAAVEGVIGYAGSHGKLPGTESDLLGAIRSSKDAYGKKLLYIFDDNLDNTSTSICETFGTNITVRAGCSDINCTSYASEANNVAFIVVSGDGNYNIQTGNISGTLNTVSNGQVYIRSVNTSTLIAVYSYGFNNTGNDRFGDDTSRDEPYDDIVKWVTLSELKSALKCPSVSVSITSPPNLPDATEDKPYNYTLTHAGGLNTKWGIVSGGSCDISLATRTFGSGGWLTLDRNTGHLHGVANEDSSSPPGVISSCTSTVTLSNVCVCADVDNDNICDPDEPYDQRTFTVRVLPEQIKITTNTLPTAKADGSSPYSVTLNASGGTGSYTFTATGLPADYNGDSDNEFYLSGNQITTSGDSTNYIPDDDPGTCTGATVNFTVTASPSSACPEAGSDTKAFTITIEDPDCFTGGGGGGCPTLALSPSSGTYSATVGVFFSTSATLSGGQSPVNILSCSPPSCNGLNFSCTSSGITISGTPTALGTCTFSATYQDSCSPTPQTVTGNYTVNIAGCPSLSQLGSFVDAQQCGSYNDSITITGGVLPYTCSLISGSLPSALSLTTLGSSCVVSGSTVEATQPSYTFTIRVTDSCPQSNDATYTLNVRGFRVRNDTGLNLSYRVNGGSCMTWGNGSTITINVDEYVEVYLINCPNTNYRIYRLRPYPCSGSCLDASCPFLNCNTRTCVLGSKDSDRDGLLRLRRVGLLTFRINDL